MPVCLLRANSADFAINKNKKNDGNVNVNVHVSCCLLKSKFEGVVVETTGKATGNFQSNYVTLVRTSQRTANKDLYKKNHLCMSWIILCGGDKGTWNGPRFNTLGLGLR